MSWLKRLTARFRPEPQQVESGSLESEVKELLVGHGLANISQYEGWSVVDGNLPGLRADYWVNGRKEDTYTIGVDVKLVLREGRHIVESYGDVATDIRQAALKNLYKFCLGTFHVFLSAYWDHHEPDQVDIETWQAGGLKWNAYLSAAVQTTSEGQTAGVPEDYMSRLRQAICALPLSEPEHWVSMFFFNLKNDWTVEVRLDNEIQGELSKVVQAMNWPSAEGYYSQRQFILLKKADTPPAL